MHGTRSGVGVQDRAGRLAAERQRAPEAAAWLRLLEIALDAAESEPWAGLEPHLPPARPADAPVLHDAFVAVDARAARRLVRGLVKAAAALGGDSAATLRALRGRTLDPLTTIEAGARQDATALDGMAAQAGADPRAFRVVAELAALPLLRGCARAAADRIPAAWRQGYCPACGGWPTLAEVRGIERSRRLRCGRCAADWSLPVLRCPFCGESDHRKLPGLLPEGQEQNRRVDGCERCGGYVKSLTTLAALPPWAIPLEDLGTLELDVAAAERGWTRPERPGYATVLRVVRTEGRLSFALGGWA